MHTLISGSLTTKYRFLAFASFALLLTFSLWAWQWPTAAPEPTLSPPNPPAVDPYYASAREDAESIWNNPLNISEFGGMGKRLRTLKEWMLHTDNTKMTPQEEEDWSSVIEGVASALVPFIRSPQSDGTRDLKTLRDSFVPGSKGLVITTGKKRFRYACHLVTNVRHVLRSQLPIQIAYSGEEDLPEEYRDLITSLAPDVSTFDVTAVFDDQSLDLPHGGWAVKAFAILGSTFEQVMLLDADDVFFQPPDVIFDEHPQYKETGTLLFHDRLLWQGAFPERHAWWEKELADVELSDTIKQSKVYMEGYAEEGDSGVVAADKSRLDVFIGLLHIAWQNTKEVREAYTYRQGHGDKESWWFGFELTGTPYSMEQHYASITGHIKIGESGNPEDRVCSFTIAHVDHKTKLLWYNGSLLKNKEIDSVDFDVPREWMIDGNWEKGATKQDMSCMSGAPVQPIDHDLVKLLEDTVDLAKKIDDNMRQHLPQAVP
ncbi:hypothetical protein A1O3_04755 [Capronia epimyces CBS 606.96]|uniref:Alpha-1,3-mannosyltransferase n=1 Tax=Capronia epimyces CBS 606.96 TaxID=1182542 RepID=W9XV28_9EURO|nr:uncharacterized protein A1O3_04755 [Capronia epimyces CBS 606.96]EXJ84088.1 hypothetical protein A1O3_04755 [Capronia epimyces CBS 606.96]